MPAMSSLPANSLTVLERTRAARRVEQLTNDSARLRRVEWLARLLDARFRIPGTKIRLGLDSLLGFIPGVGDFATMLMSGFLIHQAYQANVRKRILARMVMNVGIDSLVGVVPVAGDIFDVFYKANVKNARLLREELQRRGTIPSES